MLLYAMLMGLSVLTTSKMVPEGGVWGALRSWGSACGERGGTVYGRHGCAEGDARAHVADGAGQARDVGEQRDACGSVGCGGRRGLHAAECACRAPSTATASRILNSPESGSDAPPPPPFPRNSSNETRATRSGRSGSGCSSTRRLILPLNANLRDA
jgi:hypothetical protein